MKLCEVGLELWLFYIVVYCQAEVYQKPDTLCYLSIVAGLVVRHGDLSHKMTLSHVSVSMLIDCDKSHVSLPSCNN